MKKFFFLLILSLFFTVCCAEEDYYADREHFECGDYWYSILSDGSAQIESYAEPYPYGISSNLGTIEIPSELDGRPVTSIGLLAFTYTNASEIIIPDSITHIGFGAFNYLFEVTSITIPDSVTHIDDYAFSKSDTLTSITIPKSVVSIGKGAFAECDGLTEFTVSPENPVYAAVDGVLYDKTVQKLVAYPCGRTAESFEIPQGTKVLAAEAFSGNDHLKKVAVPESMTTIDSNPFAGCKTLSEIEVVPENPAFRVINDALFDITGQTLISYPNSFDGRCTIPDGTVTLGVSCFQDCRFTDITIPDSVTTVCDSAFEDCSLNEVVFPDGVEYIGSNAFWGYWVIPKVTLPPSVTYIADDAFDSVDMDSPLLTVKAGSYAHKYAKDHNYDYVFRIVPPLRRAIDTASQFTQHLLKAAWKKYINLSLPDLGIARRIRAYYLVYYLDYFE